MGKRIQRTWAGVLSANVTITGAPAAVRLIEDDGTGIGQGVVRLVRLIGCVNVAVTNVTIGDPNVHCWHGACLVDFDTADTSVFPIPTNGDENEGSWLWREPIPIWPQQHGQTASIDDFIVSKAFDWPIRGGKGSQVTPECKMLYVINMTTSLGLTAAQANVRILELFAAT